ncbi:hypothetical protein C2E23DRAFT_855709 [Lenzites betulinus]|nr:hypothetical protein C2E23DRAFT_855709 [Lenzites betulinus]
MSQSLAPGGGAGPGPTRGRAVTPLGRPTIRRRPGLTFQQGQRVKLRYPINDAFPAGTIVEIHGFEQAPQSATQRGNQSTEWREIDSDTLYRFLKRELVTRKRKFQSARIGNQVIHHNALSLSPGGQPADHAIPLRAMVYTTQIIQTINSHDDTATARAKTVYEVPIGTLGCTSGYATRKGGVLYGSARSNVTQNFYVVDFVLQQARWEEVICSAKKEFHNFEALSATEEAQYAARIARAPPPDRVTHFEEGLQ